MTIKTDYHLSMWREFRSKLSPHDDIKLVETLNYFSKFPLVNYVLDYDKPEQWITPWEIIADGYYDDICISILICETLINSGFNEDRFDIRYIQDSVDNSSFMIVIVDDTSVLNFSYNQIVRYEDIKNRIRTLQKYKIVDAKYKKE